MREISYKSHTLKVVKTFLINSKSLLIFDVVGINVENCVSLSLYRRIYTSFTASVV
jgi:hypothetical protein